MSRKDSKTEPLTVEQARATLVQATRNVDWQNFSTVLYMLGVLEQSWGKHPGDRWIPSYDIAWREHYYLKQNFERILEALSVLRKDSKAAVDTDSEA